MSSLSSLRYVSSLSGEESEVNDSFNMIDDCGSKKKR